MDWKNIPQVDTVKNGCEEMLKLLKQRSCSKVLNDNTNVTGAWNVAANWVAQDWFPRMIEAGLKKFAWIQSPHSALSKLAAKQSYRENEGDIIRMFESGDSEAIAWLKS